MNADEITEAIMRAIREHLRVGEKHYTVSREKILKIVKKEIKNGQS